MDAQRVIVLVAVGVYVAAVAIGKVQARAGDDATPELGSIEFSDL